MRTNHPPSHSTVARAWLAYKAGNSLARIAKRIHCAPSTLHRRFKLAGKRLRPVGRPPAKR